MQHKGTSILGDLKYKKRNVKYKKISKTFSKFWKFKLSNFTCWFFILVIQEQEKY